MGQVTYQNTRRDLSKHPLRNGAEKVNLKGASLGINFDRRSVNIPSPPERQKRLQTKLKFEHTKMPKWSPHRFNAKTHPKSMQIIASKQKRKLDIMFI